MLKLETARQQDATDVALLLAKAHVAQRKWAELPVQERMQRFRKLRDLLAREAATLTRSFSTDLQRTPAESISAEILPLAEAIRFLERNTERLLRPQWLNARDRPAWLSRVRIQLRREPLGIVLVIGPSNYPLFLPGVQALQALAMGNAVLLKPGSGGRVLAVALQQMAVEAGLPSDVFCVLSEGPEDATSALRCGVDKVFVTGSLSSGQHVLRDAAETITPVVPELSGCDAVVIRSDADICRAAQAVAFGVALNGGATCIAPRRVFVHEAVAEEFEQVLIKEFLKLRPARVSRMAATVANTAIREALQAGARCVSGGGSSFESFPPAILLDARPEMRVMRDDIFAPVISVMRVRSYEEAVQVANRCPYALGASVFGEERAAARLGQSLRAGVVVVNDMIVPTADPRLPFGGLGRSGFGKTRGAEGLLEMTRLKAMVVQGARRLRHLEPPHAEAEELFLSFLNANHREGWRHRLQAWSRVLRVAMRKGHE